MVRTTSTSDAPAAVGAYSQATTDGRLVFTAGQIPATPDSEILTDAPITAQTERTLENVRVVLKAVGLEMSDVVNTTVLLDDIDDFEAMNEVYGAYFGEHPPARSAFRAGALPKGVGVENEAVAVVE